MSKNLRNPFRMRASEKIISDASFLGIYSPTILDLLIERDQDSVLWNNVSYIHSSPGGGKTSLLRVFEPSVLNSIFTSQTHYKEIYSKLKRLTVFHESGVNLLGVYLLCSRSFEILEDINIQPFHKKRLFYSLLNSRIILSTLKNILILKNKRFPEDLSLITIKIDAVNNLPSGIKIPNSGNELYEWAANFEEKIFNALDSLIPINESIVPGHNELFAFTLMSPDYLLFNGEKVCDKVLFMIDDAHVLTKSQRHSIKEELIEKRGNFTLWISERIEVLELEEVLNPNLIKDRDFQTINLEDYYRGKDAKTSALYSAIAEKRAQLSEGSISFSDNLSIVLNEEKFKNNYIKSVEDSVLFFNQVRLTTSRYNTWLDNIFTQELSFEEKAILFKQLEIIINRQLKKQQLTLDFGSEIDELNSLLTSEIRATAIYFVSINYKIPYYYGFSNLSKISSCNIEQFLSFSAELYERMLSNNLLGNNVLLAPEEQEKIIGDIASNKWKALKNSIPYSISIMNFLMKLGAYCKSETNQINAPYAPGINGFAVKDSSKDLFKMDNWYKDPSYNQLLNVLSTCVAYNLLEVRTTYQGNKGQSWNVYYLNKWLCIYFKLPLTSGNWRHKSPLELFKWTK